MWMTSLSLIYAKKNVSFVTCVINKLYFRCMGSLKITHYNRSAQTDYRITKLPKRAYKNLTKRLLRRNREVAFVQATGTCCWHMFSDIHFVGEKQHISSGNQYRPTLNIKSLKAVEVSECR